MRLLQQVTWTLLMTLKSTGATLFNVTVSLGRVHRMLAGPCRKLCSILDPIADSLERLGGVLSWRDERLSTRRGRARGARARRIRAASRSRRAVTTRVGRALAVASVAPGVAGRRLAVHAPRAGRVRRLREDRGDLRALSAEPARGATWRPSARTRSCCWSARWRRSSPCGGSGRASRRCTARRRRRTSPSWTSAMPPRTRRSRTS